jgi:hypothetical protein
VSLPDARAIWRNIASQSEAEHGTESGDRAWRQIRELRRQLGQADGDVQEAGEGCVSDLNWMFPLPLFQAWARIQARVVLNAWLSWAKVARSANQWSSLPPAVGS